jgi:hypothetical protein
MPTKFCDRLMPMIPSEAVQYTELMAFVAMETGVSRREADQGVTLRA